MPNVGLNKLFTDEAHETRNAFHRVVKATVNPDEDSVHLTVQVYKDQAACEAGAKIVPGGRFQYEVKDAFPGESDTHFTDYFADAALAAVDKNLERNAYEFLRAESDAYTHGPDYTTGTTVVSG